MKPSNLMFFLASSFLLASCGSSGGHSAPNNDQSQEKPAVVDTPVEPVLFIPPTAPEQAIAPVEPVVPAAPDIPIVPVVVPPPVLVIPDLGTVHYMNYNLQRKVYIIAGDTNAEMLRAQGTGGSIISVTAAGASVSDWTQSFTNTPLLNQVASNCSQNPYVIWYQGNADVMSPNSNNYRNNLVNLYNKIIGVCSNVAIVTVTINPALLPGTNATQIMNTQMNLMNTKFYNASSFTSNQGYSNLWNNIKLAFPLTGALGGPGMGM